MYLLKFAATAALALDLAAAPAMARDADDAIGRIKPLSLEECGVKYRAARAAGVLGERKWREFRTTECGFDSASAAARLAPLRSEAAKAETVRRLAFPTEIASEFKTDKPSQARMRTCLKTYRENKQAGALFGVRWVERGGGYYSLCAVRLKTNA